MVMSIAQIDRYIRSCDNVRRTRRHIHPGSTANGGSSEAQQSLDDSLFVLFDLDHLGLDVSGDSLCRGNDPASVYRRASPPDGGHDSAALGACEAIYALARASPSQ